LSLTVPTFLTSARSRQIVDENATINAVSNSSDGSNGSTGSNVVDDGSVSDATRDELS